MKLRKSENADKEFSLSIKKQDFSTLISEKSENVYPFVFISCLVSCLVCIYIEYFFDANSKQEIPKS